MAISKSTRAMIELAHTDRLANAMNALVTFARRKDRLEHPEGSFDNASRWFPSNAEDCGVSGYIRTPSRSWPNSYMVACRTLDHCERLFDADHEDVLALRRYLTAQGVDVTTLVDRKLAFQTLSHNLMKLAADDRAARALRVPVRKAKNPSITTIAPRERARA